MNNLWKPKKSIAIFLGIIFQSFTFLYVGKVTIFWIYSIVTVFLAIIDFYTGYFFTLILSLLCPIHASRLADEYQVQSQRKWYTRWWVIPSFYFSFLVPILFTRSFLYEPFHIPSTSMSPTINVGEYIIIKKWGYGNYGTFGIRLMQTYTLNPKGIKRGAIYVFYLPNKDVPFIKRLIGMPGDSVEIKGHKLIINGNELTTKFINEDGTYKTYSENYGGKVYQVQNIMNQRIRGDGVFNIPEGQYFFLGDNRDQSYDSRYWGTIGLDKFLGELIYTF